MGALSDLFETSEGSQAYHFAAKALNIWRSFPLYLAIISSACPTRDGLNTLKYSFNNASQSDLSTSFTRASNSSFNAFGLLYFFAKATNISASFPCKGKKLFRKLRCRRKEGINGQLHTNSLCTWPNLHQLQPPWRGCSLCKIWSTLSCNLWSQNLSYLQLKQTDS